jgi:hypothetical protein
LEEDVQMDEVFEGLVVTEAMQIFGEFGFGNGGAIFKAKVDNALVSVFYGFDLS